MFDHFKLTCEIKRNFDLYPMNIFGINFCACDSHLEQAF